jgi:capsular exopolysaccharide synthesis family protein
VLAVTSSLPAEGKSTVSGNLAVALAETGARVLLVDADLRRPAIAELLGVEGGVGLTTVLAGAARVEDVVQDWGGKQLQVLASGPVPPNPAELLGSPAMRGLLEDLRGRYDHVVIDTAPLLPVADAAVLSRLVDGTLLVAQAGRVRRAELTRALGNLDQVSARVLGIVLNRVRGEESSYSYGRIAHEDEPQATAADDHARQTLVVGR